MKEKEYKTIIKYDKEPYIKADYSAHRQLTLSWQVLQQALMFCEEVFQKLAKHYMEKQKMIKNFGF